jgi:pyruvate,water dikinase
MQDPGSWLVSLSNPLCADPARVGGKAAQLHALRQAEFPVPAAWVVSHQTFQSHLPDARPSHKPGAITLADDLRESLRSIYSELSQGGAHYLVVRSSALSEDGVDHSFAGQHATYYYIDSDNLEKAVVDCWLSLWSTAATAYRRAISDTQSTFGMAVIIQQMIQADRSGVCFTQDPTGQHDDHTLIEATWGLGAALVDGRVSPDRYWLNRDFELSYQKIGRKRLKVAEKLRDPSGQRLEPVPAGQQASVVLSARDARRIAEMAAKAARLRGGPQDMEWAMAGGELYALQSRPITALPQPIALNPIEGRWVLFKPLVENFTEPLTPVTVDLFRRVLPPLGKFIHGRYYLNVDVLARLLPFELDESQLQRLLLLKGPLPQLRLAWRRLPVTIGLILFGYLSTGVSWHRSTRVPLNRLADFERRCDGVLVDVDCDALESLHKLFFNRHPFLPISEFAFQTNVSSARYFGLIGVLQAILRRIAPDFDQNKLASLFGGGEATLSRQMVDGVSALADVAREDRTLTSALCGGDGRQLHDIVIALSLHHPFLVALAGFMATFGHRTVREMDLLSPRWREDSSTVLQMVRNFLKNDGSSTLDPHGLQLAAIDELHQLIKPKWQRKLIDHLLTRIRYYVTLRENTRHYHTMAFAVIREKLKLCEQQLIQESRLRCADDIFFLEWPEITGLTVGALSWEDVEPTILQRRRRYRRQCDFPPKASFNLSSAGSGATRTAGKPGHYSGDCACPGIAEGIAKVVLDPGLGADLEPGEVLIAPYTDPAWTPLFPNAKAIVVEIGSYLSHAGTVAREYQIPCLVDVEGCTRVIRTGQKLRVNATEGWVEVIE